MLRRRMPFVILAGLQLAGAGFGCPAVAAETVFTDFPFMVHCQHSGIDRAFYLSKIGPDGVAVYLSPDRLAGVVTIHGAAAPVAGDASGSCAGRTIKELRASGQAFDLH